MTTDTDTVQESAERQAEELTLKQLIGWLANQTWSRFAQDLVKRYNDRGDLSLKQEVAARSMYAKIVAKAAMRTAGTATPAVVPIGIHRNPTGAVIKVYTTQSGQLATKELIDIVDLSEPTGLRYEFDYRGKKGLAGLSADTLLPMDEAKKFGRLTKRCINCLYKLTDERSLAAGYGAKCAHNHGWFYPNMKQAMAIIERENLAL